MDLSRQTLRCAFLIACLMLPRTLPAAESATAAAAPLPPEVQQKLTALQTGYEAYLLKNATTPYEEGLRALHAKVRPALERESRAAAQRKDLDGLVRIKADLARIDKNEILPEVNDPQLAPSLATFYAAYKLELSKLKTDWQSHFADATSRYDKGLAQVQDEMTTTQQVEAALEVKKIRDTLAKAETTTAPWAATTTAEGAGAGAGTSKVTNTATGTPATPASGPAAKPGAAAPASPSSTTAALATVEMSGELATFKEGARPYTNRPQEVFILTKTPPTLRGLSFIKATRSVKTPHSIQVLKPGRLYIACTANERGRETDVDVKYLGTLGFEKTPHSFVINDVTLAVCAKTVDTSFNLDPSQENSGFIVIGHIQAAPAKAGK